MKQTKLFTLLAALICATTMTWAQTFLGSGNSTDPYLLKSSIEWKDLGNSLLRQVGISEFFGQFQRNFPTSSSSVASSARNG